MMTLSKKILLSALPAALLTPAVAAGQPAAPAAAQQSGTSSTKAAKAEATVTAGAKVSDTKGGEVGSISKVDGEFVILKTDKHEARLPASSLAAREGGLVVAMTRDELNAEVEKRLGATQGEAPAAAEGAKPQ